jgi:glycosyltransferase involved in cell wall biosynthesis
MCLAISIITVCYNSQETISKTIESVLAQTYSRIEYIIIDGGSSDDTIKIIKKYDKRITKFVTEPDSGIYDAINKGIRLATGDIIGILNSDDFFYNDRIVEKIVPYFMANDVDAVYGDVQFVKRNNTYKIVRYYSSKFFNPRKFRFGFMPAHLTFYTKRELFDKFGYYKSDYTIAADFELLLRFIFINKIRYKYIEMPFVTMRKGGISNKSFLSNYKINKEILRACKENGLYTNYLFIYLKYFIKIFQFINLKKIKGI